MGEERVITICATCGEGATGPALARVLDLPEGWRVRMHDCLSQCDRPCAVAVQGAGRATYLFGGLEAADAGDLAAFAKLYDAAPHGWIEDARPAGRVRFCLTGRVPARDLTAG